METTLTDTRRSFAKLAMLVLLAGLVLRILQVALSGAAAIVTENINIAVPTPAVLPTSQPTFVRLDWISQCDSTKQGLALYVVGDSACQPNQIVSLTWLQSQLATKGLLASTEYLEWVANPADAACRAAVLAGPGGAPAGLVCADWRGIYRVGADGQDAGKRLQFWSDGNWVQSQ